MKFSFRILLDISIIAFAIAGYWPLLVTFGFLGLVFFDFYLEIVIAGIIFDSLFGINRELGIYSYSISILTLIIFLLYKFLNKILRK